MSTINKVPASAGAEWLLAGFALLKRAPVPLATLAVLWGLLSMGVMLVAVTLPAMTLAMQFLLVTMRLHYGGSLWGPVLERLLGDEIERSRSRLLDLVSDST